MEDSPITTRARSMHLDTRSRRALWVYRILAYAAPAIFLLSTQVDSWLNETWWAWLASACLAALIGFGALFASRKVRCPACGHSAVESYAPSWRQVKPLYSRDAIRCEYCQETIVMRGAHG